MLSPRLVFSFLLLRDFPQTKQLIAHALSGWCRDGWGGRVSSLEGKCLRFGSENYSNTWFCVSVHLPALPHVLDWSPDSSSLRFALAGRRRGGRAGEKQHEEKRHVKHIQERLLDRQTGRQTGQRSDIWLAEYHTHAH